MVFRRCLAAGLIVWLGVIHTAAAQAPDAGSRAAAKALVATMGGSTMVTKIFAAMRGQIINIIVERGHVTQQKAQAAWDEILMPEMVAHANELTNAIAEVYSENFTSDDLRGLQAFYGTPLGRKLLEKQPIVGSESMAIGRAWGQRVGRDAFEKHKQDLQKRGITL